MLKDPRQVLERNRQIQLGWLLRHALDEREFPGIGGAGSSPQALTKANQRLGALAAGFSVDDLFTMGPTVQRRILGLGGLQRCEQHLRTVHGKAHRVRSDQGISDLATYRRAETKSHRAGVQFAETLLKRHRQGDPAIGPFLGALEPVAPSILGTVLESTGGPEPLSQVLAGPHHQELAALLSGMARDWEGLADQLALPKLDQRGGFDPISTLKGWAFGRGDVTRLDRWTREMAGALGSAMGLEVETVATALHQRRQRAVELLLELVTVLEHAVGEVMARRLLRQLDLERTVYDLARPQFAHGPIASGQGRTGALLTALEDEGSLHRGIERLAERLGQRALVEEARRLLRSGVFELDYALPLRPHGEASLLAVVALLRTLEPLAQLDGLGLAAEVRRLRLGGRLNALLASALTAEVRAALRDYRSNLVEMQVNLQNVRAQDALVRSELRSHTFSLPRSLKSQLEDVARRAYPNEAMGLILRAGGDYTFIELSNLHAEAGSPEADRLGVADPEQIDRVHHGAQLLGLEVAAFFHTHPDTRPIYNGQDLEMLRTYALDVPEVRAYIVSCDGQRCAHASFGVDPDGACRNEDRIKEFS